MLTSILTPLDMKARTTSNPGDPPARVEDRGLACGIRNDLGGAESRPARVGHDIEKDFPVRHFFPGGIFDLGRQLHGPIGVELENRAAG